MTWIIQGSPDPLAIAGMDRQAVRVVQRRTEIHGRRGLIRAEEEHTGQWRQPELAHFITQENLSLYIYAGIAARVNHETIGTRGARRVKQCVEHQMFIVFLRAFNPEFTKTRELL